MINIKELKDAMLAEMSAEEEHCVDVLMDAYKKIMRTVASCDMNDRQILLALSHSLVRCAKIIDCPKESLVDNISRMYDILTLLESQAEGGMQ